LLCLRHLFLMPANMNSTPPTDLVTRLRNGGQPDLADMAARMDMALRQVFYAAQFEQLCPGTFDFKRCEDVIRAALTTDTQKEPT
jgi:hypothetical protein